MKELYYVAILCQIAFFGALVDNLFLSSLRYKSYLAIVWNINGGGTIDPRAYAPAGRTGSRVDRREIATRIDRRNWGRAPTIPYAKTLSVVLRASACRMRLP